MSKKKIALIVLLIVLVVCQLRRVDQTNPTFDTSQDFMEVVQPEAEFAEMLQSSCYDCHSLTTEYPWYFNIAPISWWLRGHIDNGRAQLNFSTFGTLTASERSHLLQEMAEEITATRMPPLSYQIGHSEAKLSTEERERLSTWLKKEADK